MRSRRFSFRNLLFCVFSFVFVATLAFLAAHNINQSQAYTSGFKAGNIISDAAMRDYNSLSESDIQRFLKSKNSCNDTNLSKTGNNINKVSEAYPPISWHVSGGHYVCMADDSFSGGTAAHIIYRAAQDYHINPKVLIVLLQKEQSLITDTYPNSLQYRSATGFGCPDTGACSSKYYGLSNQIRNAASLFNTVLNGGWTNFPIGWNYIQYNPNSSCGGSKVYIENLATSALYRYTPYQPGGNSSKNCAAYGNINFYSYYTNWFGSTQQVFKASDLDNIYLANGTYNIVTTNGKTALDVKNSGTGNGTNIQIATYTKNNAQSFKITRGSDGFYAIASTISGKVLDVSNGSVLPGANVQLYTSNNTCAQKWAISYDSNKHYVFRNACSGNALDVSNGAIANSGTNVQIYTYNKTAAQEWDLVALSGATISDGTYNIMAKTGLTLDVAGGKTANGTNVQIHSRNLTAAQSFKVTRGTDGYYTITNTNANKVLDIKSASTANGANIQIYQSNNTCAQKWVIENRSNGFYAIRNACIGKALDISSGKISTNGANVQSWNSNGTDAQLWMFTAANSVPNIGGTYYLKTTSGYALDVAGGKTANGTNIWLYSANKTAAQKFRLTKTSDNYYTITNPSSGKVLDVSGAGTTNGSNVQLYQSNNTCAQKWLAVSMNNGYSFRNACSGKTLDVSSGKISTKGANVQIWGYNSTAAQQWILEQVK